MKKVRTRFAPSPTGYLHVGGLRTALYAYLFAKQNKGDFLLRIDDTDRNRYVEGSVEKLIRSLEWAGLTSDEGPRLEASCSCEGKECTESTAYPNIYEKGNSGPYVQSERLDIYKKYAEELLEKGHAYYCFCSSEDLTQMREEQMKNKQPTKYDKRCLKLTEEEIQEKLDSGVPHVIRMKVPENETIEFQDIVRGKVSFHTSTVDDQVLIKSDGFPTYHLASTVDDHTMEISHVIRAEEWLSSTPKHILIHRYLGWEMPEIAHIPLLLNTDKSKLSKRQGDVAVQDYVNKGYLKEAIINFTALLGWNPGKGSEQEIFSLEELIEKFDLHNVHKAGAVFDMQKLNWINAQYIKKLSSERLFAEVMPFLEKKEFFAQAPSDRKTEDFIKRLLVVEQDRLETLDQVGEDNLFFFVENIETSKDELRWKQQTDEELAEMLTKALTMMESISDADWTDKNRLEEIFMEAAGDKRGDFLWPLRMALTGAKKSPPPYEVAWVLGKDLSIERASKGINCM